MSFIKYLVVGTLGTGIIVLFYNTMYGLLFAFGNKMGVAGAPDNIIADSQLGFNIGIVLMLLGLIIFLILAASKEEYETTQL